MTSIHTNAGAISALQTLRSISSQMGETQRQVSTGLRVGAASDNSAYWSIATTMQSDNMALSAVQDALGLGAAKADTAYAGMSSVVEILKQFDARLVAAKEDGVDKRKIQGELDQLKDQAVSIASSASFNGQNWLQTDTNTLNDDDVSVTASFVRSSFGIRVEKIDIKLKELSLINSTGGGILQKDVASTIPVPTPSGLGGLLAGVTSNDAHAGHTWFSFSGPGTLGVTDVIQFDIEVDNWYGSVTINDLVINAALGRSDATINDAAEMSIVLHHALQLQTTYRAGSAVGGYRDSNVVSGAVDIGSEEMGGIWASKVAVSNVTSTLPAGFAFGMEGPFGSHNNEIATGVLSFDSGIQFGLNGLLNIAGSAGNTSLMRANIDDALGTNDGLIDSAAKMATVINYMAANFGFPIRATASTSSNDIVLIKDQAQSPGYGKLSNFDLQTVGFVDVFDVPLAVDSSPAAGTFVVDFDLVDVDITTGDIDHYINGVQEMLRKATSGAAVLGSLSNRINLQMQFSAQLSDSLDSGIGRLVDADMNEASTRLKALQTQEQLATQSLSIANANAEGILTLFR